MVNSNLLANATSNNALNQGEYQSIFNAYNSPPLKLRQSGMLEKKIPTTEPVNKESFSQYMQQQNRELSMQLSAMAQSSP